MSLGVTFNGVRISDYLTVTEGFNRNVGSSRSLELQKKGDARGKEFLSATTDEGSFSMPFVMRYDLISKRRELAGILDVKEPKMLIFDDEPNVYYMAIPKGDVNVAEKNFSGKGEITWTVPDALAHAMTIKTFPAALNSNGILEATIVNEGTADVPISYRVKHGNHDNSFIGIASDLGALEFGKIDEADGEIYRQNEQMANIQTFANLPNDTGANIMHPNHVMDGSLIAENIPGSNSYFPTCLRLDATADVSQKWHGGMRTFTVPADSEGEVGAKDFYCYLNHWFETGLMGQTAEQSIAFLTEDNKVICGYSLFKADMSGNTANLEYWINGRVARSIAFTPSYSDAQNPFNNGRGHNDIRKVGDTVTFYWWGTYPTISDPAIKDMVCKKVQVAFTQFDTRGMRDKYVTRNYLRAINFQKMYVEKWKDIPNRYPAGCEFYANGAERKPYVDGALVLNDEIKGTKYFYAPPGETKVEFHYSDFGVIESVTAEIREAWI